MGPKTNLMLIVDDNVEFRTMVSDYFTDLGFTVEIAGDGREGLLKAKAIRPDIILCDVMMPDIGGIEVLRNLQTDDDTRDIPVLVITGSFFDKNMSELFRQESNCREFMSKTVELSYLQKKVEALVPKKP
ncbi:MAG: response regulator [Elusimicrobiales bacterium]|nr:response regulator [Elusimicrobiales bacterium]